MLITREATLQLKRQLLAGEMMEKAEIERQWAQRVTAVRVGLEQLGRALAPAIVDFSEDDTTEDAERLVWEYVEPLLLAYAGAGTP